MRTVFPPWSDTAFRIALSAGALSVLTVVLAPMVWVRTPYSQNRRFPVEQPVQFDHRHHVRDDGIDCRYCHEDVGRSPHAGVPATELCMGCHAQVWPGSPLLEPVRRSFFSGQPIAWNRVHALPGFVYFDHSAHTLKGVGCVECHGRVDRMPLVEQVAPLTMGWCLDCHRDPAPHLRPLDQIASMTWRPPGDARAYGESLARRYGVRSLTHCTTCHR